MRDLLRLAVPVIVARAGMMTMALAGTLFVGRYGVTDPAGGDVQCPARVRRRVDARRHALAVLCDDYGARWLAVGIAHGTRRNGAGGGGTDRQPRFSRNADRAILHSRPARLTTRRFSPYGGRVLMASADTPFAHALRNRGCRPETNCRKSGSHHRPDDLSAICTFCP